MCVCERERGGENRGRSTCLSASSSFSPHLFYPSQAAVGHYLVCAGLKMLPGQEDILSI